MSMDEGSKIFGDCERGETRRNRYCHFFEYGCDHSRFNASGNSLARSRSECRSWRSRSCALV